MFYKVFLTFCPVIPHPLQIASAPPTHNWSNTSSLKYKTLFYTLYILVWKGSRSLAVCFPIQKSLWLQIGNVPVHTRGRKRAANCTCTKGDKQQKSLESGRIHHLCPSEYITLIGTHRIYIFRSKKNVSSELEGGSEHEKGFKKKRISRSERGYLFSVRGQIDWNLFHNK